MVHWSYAAFTEEQIAQTLREAETDAQTIRSLCHTPGSAWHTCSIQPKTLRCSRELLVTWPMTLG